MRARIVAVALALGVLTGLPVLTAAPAPAAETCASPGGLYDGEVPWAQRRLHPEAVWPVTRGEGVSVAVLGTGIDRGHPQLSGRVAPGTDLTTAQSAQARPADDDCDGRGTVLAGLVAAAPSDLTPVAGVAPGAELLPVRVVQTRLDTEQGELETRGGTATELAAGLRAATEAGAEVILVAVTTPTGSADLRDAVAEALAAGAVVVAGGPAADDGSGTVPAYPSRYPGVIAVAPVAEDGTVLDGADGGAHVDLAAPGGGVVSTAAGSGTTPGHVGPLDEPAAGAAYVAGVAALVRAAHPDLGPREVAWRLVVTADRTSAGFRTGPVGAGMVDPVAAVTARLTQSGVPTNPGVRDILPYQEPIRVDAAERRALRISVLLTLGALVAGLTALAVRTARRRRGAVSRAARP